MSITRFANTLASRRVWHLVDAKHHINGRLAAQISTVLQGKHKPSHHPGYDNGDYVVVINADKVKLSSKKKWQQKLYRWHTGYPGGLREVPAERMMRTNPTSIVKHAVSGMLPKTRTRTERMHRLKVYSGEDHPHVAQLEDPINKLMLENSGGFPWVESRPEGMEFPERRKERKRHIRARYDVEVQQDDQEFKIVANRLESSIPQRKRRGVIETAPRWDAGKTLNLDELVAEQKAKKFPGSRRK
mmetsp:Transcript_37058/g.92971  ORF Transcript_37058/g.92971 Transcript_37058/m.92971 type:complete len:244 (+) Transcript_37058:151-882(+)|eukprot:CAMPEP_0177651238 /NCGR_PEP_ID=MMETSP0447-20121125/12424_1 /TAXON_ID=0 /ORGANISM="Stygamoeba regulata, Strain BSH-02190019" /LENGTH=243 /DNA_ID=CAMNT_0019154271 /DNA_START=146 /DNA_END=877 /DNA_ORIENTATION=-